MADSNWGFASLYGGNRDIQELVRRWPSSGTTQKRYCTRHGISLSSFSYWRRRLAAECAKGPALTQESATGHSAFREVVITGAPVGALDPTSEPRVDWPIEVSLPNGAVVRFASTVEASAISTVLCAVAAAW